LAEVLTAKAGAGFSDTDLVNLVNSMERPITFHFNVMPTSGAAVASSSSAVPVPITLPPGSSGTTYEKDKVSLPAGAKLKVDMPVSIRAGGKIMVEFWVEEPGMDIWFSIQRKGKTDLVYPYSGRVGTHEQTILPQRD
jgi:hypothetical protein